jgi:hypothetical protein
VVLYYPDNLGAVRTTDAKDFFYGKPNAQGFYPQQNLFINWSSATPLASADASSSSSAAVWIVIAIVVVAALAGAAIVIRRRSTATERE